ncbi:MAG: DUF262 domain-containing protein [Christensenellaceae bacterium]|jgi:hypothetical protein|nr:DUF262 domain-containing protein [Christensenellaceae bacterium]
MLTNTQSTVANLQKIISDILTNKIMLPDFQRKFVWSDVDKQKKLVASILAKMPIGCFLELKGKSDEYVARKIGIKTQIKTETETQTNTESTQNESIPKEVYFLLDGQQRVTVLSVVFSSSIFLIAKKSKNLVDASLKRRFFIKIPKNYDQDTTVDLFGAKNLQFPNISEEKIPEFSTKDVFDLIVTKDYISNSNLASSPYIFFDSSSNKKIEIETLKSECNISNEPYLVPLFLLIEDKTDGTNCNALMLKKIIKSISDSIKDAISQNYESIENSTDADVFVKNVFSKDHLDSFLKDKNSEKTKQEIFESLLEAQAEEWRYKFFNYLKDCVNNMGLIEFKLEAHARDRAIDIYENLNLGGVKLDVFDLIVAKVGKKNTENFYSKIFNIVNNKKEYSADVLPETITVLYNKISNEYNATVSIYGMKEKEDLPKTFSKSFLNVMSLKYHIGKLNKKLTGDITNEKSKLLITPDFILENYEKVCVAVDRALFFFNMRCGIRKFTDIHYKLIIDIVAFVFLEDKNFKDKKIHNLLEAWYWAVIFSGEFDKDQKSQFVSHLSRLIDTIKNIGDSNKREWINTIKNNVLDVSNFADKNLLLLNNATTGGRIPKEHIEDLICQFYLAGTYQKLFDKEVRLYAFSNDSDKLQIHHIIPLSLNVISIDRSTSTKTLRDDKTYILNSPLNKIFITAEENTKIGNTSFANYKDKINSASKTELDLNFKTDDTKMSVNDIKDFLEFRFKQLRGRIANKINSNLDQIN